VGSSQYEATRFTVTRNVPVDLVTRIDEAFGRSSQAVPATNKELKMSQKDHKHTSEARGMKRKEYEAALD
jgi:hypothetical protein